MSRPPAQEEWSAWPTAIVKTFKRRTRKLYKAHLGPLFYQPDLRKWKRMPLPGGASSSNAAVTFLKSRAKVSLWSRAWRHKWIVASVVTVVLVVGGVALAMIWREPKDVEAYLLRGKEYADHGKFPEAAADFTERN